MLVFNINDKGNATPKTSDYAAPIADIDFSTRKNDMIVALKNTAVNISLFVKQKHS